MNNMEATNLVLTETAGFSDMHNRPYSMHLAGESVHQIQGILSDTQITDYSPAQLSAVSSDVLQYGDVEGVSAIPNGWSNTRFNYTLSMAQRRSTDYYDLITVNGYTDKSDMSMQGTLDPNMVFFINNVEVSAVRSIGGQQSFNPTDSAQVLIPEHIRLANSGDNWSLDGSSLYTLRPSDVVLNKVNSECSFGQDESSMDSFDMGNTIDLSTTLGTSAVPNSRKYLNPGKYLSSLVTSHIYAGFSESGQMESTSYGMLAPTRLAHNPFIAILSDIAMRNSDSGKITGTFRLHDLREAFSYIDQMTDVYKMAHNESRDSIYHDSNDIISHTAMNVINHVSSFMSNHKLSGCIFRADTKSLTGEFVDIEGVTPGVGGSIQDTHRLATMLNIMINNELLPNITAGGQRDIRLKVDATLNARARIGLTIDGINDNNWSEALYPMFTDGAWTSVLTSNENTMGDQTSMLLDMCDISRAPVIGEDSAGGLEDPMGTGVNQLM